MTLVHLLLVPVVIFFALPLAIMGAFVALAMIGHATNIITGLAVSLQDAVLPITVITAGMGITYSVGDGTYGVAVVAAALLSAVMLTMDSIVVAVNSYDPFTDNADWIAGNAELAHEVRTISDALDAVGNTTKAMAEGYAIGSAATTTSMGCWPTGMARSTRTLTVSLPVLAIKT